MATEERRAAWIRSTLTLGMTAAAVAMARAAASPSWRRPSCASTPGSNDWTPMETRLTPASRQAASRARSQDSGLASMVTSAPAGSRQRPRTPSTTAATSSAAQRDGVPPPR